MLWIVGILIWILVGITLAETKKDWGIKNRKDYLISVVFEPITFILAIFLGILFGITILFCHCITPLSINKLAAKL